MHGRWRQFKPSRVNLFLLGSGLVLVITRLVGPNGTVAGYNLGKGAPRWVQYAWPAAGGVLILMAVLVGWTPTRVLWTGRGFVGVAPRLPPRHVKRPAVARDVAR